MTKAVEFRPEALDELGEGTVWFEERRPGLGSRFVAEVRATVARIVASPDAWPPVRGAGSVRSARVKGFRYRVFFEERVASVRILAVSHDARRPRYWKDRRKS